MLPGGGGSALCHAAISLENFLYAMWPFFGENPCAVAYAGAGNARRAWRPAGGVAEGGGGGAGFRPRGAGRGNAPAPAPARPRVGHGRSKERMGLRALLGVTFTPRGQGCFLSPGLAGLLPPVPKWPTPVAGPSWGNFGGCATEGGLDPFDESLGLQRPRHAFCAPFWQSVLQGRGERDHRDACPLPDALAYGSQEGLPRPLLKPWGEEQEVRTL